jgi:hypothetical protein
MPALQVGIDQEICLSLDFGKNETCADILSAAKIFIPCLKMKMFCTKCLGLSYFIRICNVDAYKRRAKIGVMVSCMVYTLSKLYFK